MDKYLAVAIGGAFGAVARYWLSVLITERFPSRFPYGTVVINITGSFIIGLLMVLVADRVNIHANWRLAFAVGFVGAYTTFSTFEYETFKLIEGGQMFVGLMNVFVSLILGFLAVWGVIVLAKKVIAPALNLNEPAIMSVHNRGGNE